MSTAEQLKSEDAPQSRRGPVPFGNYLLDDLIAVGGMARVYRARLRGALGFEKPLVVKQVRPELAKDPRFVAMFALEAKTLVRLTHPHIVTVYELGVVDETYFIAMEYIEGVTLQALVDNERLSPEFAAHIASQVCDALHHAHERFDLVHRDVTPRNILIDEEGQTRLVDFGIAVPREDAGGVRGNESGFGSVGYMSPEQLTGATLGPRSDVFSLGCAIHRSLFGEVPFQTDDTTLVRAPLRYTEADEEHPFATHIETMISLSAAKRPNAREAGRVFRSWLSKTHPEGVGQELGALVSEVREAQSTQPSVIDPDKPEVGQTSTTRSLATSPLLPSSGEILDAEAAEASENSGTVPLPGRGGREPVAPEAPSIDTPTEAATIAPPTKATSKRRSLVVLISGALLVGAAVASNAWRSEPEAAPESTALTRERAEEPQNVAFEVPEPDRETPEVSETTEAQETPEAPETPETQEAPEPATQLSPMTASPMRQAPEPVAGHAFVVFASTPWAEVYIDGERAGVTPLRERLPRGRHAIRLVNPALGSELTRSVNLEGGETLRLRADFNSTPPTFR